MKIFLLVAILIVYLRANVRGTLKENLSRSKDNESLFGAHLVTSLVKRLIRGTFQGRFEPKYLQNYLDEFVFRFNRRNKAAKR